MTRQFQATYWPDERRWTAGHFAAPTISDLAAKVAPAVIADYYPGGGYVASFARRTVEDFLRQPGHFASSVHTAVASVARRHAAAQAAQAAGQRDRRHDRRYDYDHILSLWAQGLTAGVISERAEGHPSISMVNSVVSDARVRGDPRAVPHVRANRRFGCEWAEVNVVRLVAMAEDQARHWTAGEIARALGVTRAAVIGKLRRLHTPLSGAKGPRGP